MKYEENFLILKTKLKQWVNSEVAKQLDKEPFSSLPLKMRTGILMMLFSFVIGHSSTIFVLIIPVLNRHLSIGGFLKGSLIYIICWFTGFFGLMLAGRDCIKFPKYFLAKFLKIFFPGYFMES